ncbi:lipocalin family protein [Winogradskyella eckloniae]|uniref:lipocalin family protein n=1 Tax=Winogradskyella eckloniae TaxID=1089306 RepID=UPI00156753C4|nr:lipocalin family protein [Winogradskyella eckloniae]NRD20295.1 lipocalin family protein [Winogradskyella eckloniae]
MRTSLLFFTFISICFYSCSNDNSEPNPLINTGIIGEWKINSRGIDNTSSTEVVCCETLIFTDNDNDKDYIGYYTFIYEEEYYGAFTLNTENNTIAFTNGNGNINTETFSLTDNTLELWYYENENRHWTIYTKVIDE